MSSSLMIDPTRVYQIGGQVCPVISTFFAQGISANNALVTGVAGKVIAIMGLVVQSNNVAQGTLQLLDGSGGTNLYSFLSPPNTALPFVLPIDNHNYGKTTVGNGLFSTILTQAQQFTLHYIIYTP